MTSYQGSPIPLYVQNWKRFKLALISTCTNTIYDFEIIFSSAWLCVCTQALCLPVCSVFERYLSPLYPHVQNDSNNNTKFTGAYRDLNLMRRAECVKYLFCTYSVLMAPIFPLELPWASLNCSQNTSFLFRPLTVINRKRHLSKGFEMANLDIGPCGSRDRSVSTYSIMLFNFRIQQFVLCSLLKRWWPYKLLLTISAGWNIISLRTKPQLSLRI